MKIVWTLVALLLLGGLIVLLQPPSTGDGSRMSSTYEVPTAPPPPAKPAPATPEASLDAALARAAGEASAEPARATTPIPTTTPAAEPEASEPAKVAAAEPGLAPASGPLSEASNDPLKEASKEASKEPSKERAAPSAEAKAAGTQFSPEIPSIPEAEISPSTFLRLADGSIAVDDAWTITGEGTDDAPYEVSWEFLSSAQDSYVPRLGERKIPARIAFLSGKRVRISGYLAFPLVAPTSSECLVMLNQWDGCCIGIPPTPYDAIEVKLAQELKGWKKHTLNFGAVEGTLRVEPYLVENWLVGLYLLEGAKVNREL